MTTGFARGAAVYACALALFLAATARAAAPAKPLVMLDPGHGGADHGVTVDGFDEASYSLALAQKAGAALRKQGLDVRLTRVGDAELGIESRTAQANASGALALVSLHANYSYNTLARGLRVFVPPAGPVDETAAPLWEQASRLHSAESKRLGLQLAASLGQKEGKAVQSLKLALFRGLKIPAAQVELDFASNPQGLAALADPAALDAAAEKLALGIAAYVRDSSGAALAPAAP
jgi:N-acetylmuramoyl-L-alanine amidase